MNVLSFRADNGLLLVRTGVEGRLARLGHRMTIALTDWTVDVELYGERPVRAELTVLLSGFDVRKAEGGVTPLTRADRALVRSNAMRVMRAADFPRARFSATRIVPASPSPSPSRGFELAGSARIAGVRRDLNVVIGVGEEEAGWRLAASTSLKHSDFGLRPYSQMLGGLRVCDRVGVEFTASVPRPGD